MTNASTKNTHQRIISAAAILAIAAGAIFATMGNPGEADAALKWREEVVKWNVKAEKCHKTDPCADTTATTDTTTTP